MIGIVDYGVGNLYSLTCSLRNVGEDAVVTREEAILREVDRIILPGVGAFADARERLRILRLDSLLQSMAAQGKPLLGICLGMQLLFSRSFEYGEHEGLGLISGEIRSLQEALSAEAKVPHMGWNGLCFKEKENPLLKGVEAGDFVYYVHSYYATECEEALVAWAEYGNVRVPGVVQRKNVFGTQFHPEKSGEVGLRMLANFGKEVAFC